MIRTLALMAKRKTPSSCLHYTAYQNDINRLANRQMRSAEQANQEFSCKNKIIRLELRDTQPC